MTAFPAFEVIPAVDLQDGQVVQLVGGERGTGNTYGDPVEAAERWVAEGAETLHLVDLDGAFSGERANATAIDRIRSAVDVDLQLGGGIRSITDAEALLSAGIDRVILGTAAVDEPEIVSSLEERHPGAVVVSLDASEGEVVIEGWTAGTGLRPAAAAAAFEERGAAAILFTNVDVEGRLGGVDEHAVADVAVAVDIPVIASGGVSSIDDLQQLRRAGAGAVVVGTALYEGEFSLSAAIEAVAE